MKKIFCFLFMLYLLLLTGCEIKSNYQFLNDTKNIVSIQIVQVTWDNSTHEFKEHTLSTIDDINMFLDEFCKLDCYSLYTDPLGIDDNSIVIKIIYNNQEYELISSGGRAQYTQKKGFQNYTGYRYFDDEPFQKLIEKYLIS